MVQNASSVAVTRFPPPGPSTRPTPSWIGVLHVGMQIIVFLRLRCGLLLLFSKTKRPSLARRGAFRRPRAIRCVDRRYGGETRWTSALNGHCAFPLRLLPLRPTPAGGALTACSPHTEKAGGVEHIKWTLPQSCSMCSGVRVGGRALPEPDADQVKVLVLSIFRRTLFLRS